MSTTDNKKAFTIIEVVLVLAVAGLIFLVVFAAVPRLQASRRDNQRKRDAESLVALAIEFSSNVGRMPTETEIVNAIDSTSTTATAFRDYVEDENLQDPSGGDYQYYTLNTVADNGPGEYRFYTGPSPTRCNASNTWWEGNTAGSSTDWFLIMFLERGVYCIDNQ